MKRYSLSIFLICFFSFANFCYAQTAVVKGKILDAKTDEPLPFANVFINQTTFGSSTALDGSFVLSNIPYGTYELIISYVGYRTYSSKLEVAPGKQIDLRINLTATETQLTEVEVKTSPDKSWARSLQRFNAEFFGKSEFTKSCKILNPWVLNFKQTDEGIFYATASAPLQIENLALGYRVVYYLKDLVATNQSYNISGNVKFEELQASDNATASRWQQNRLKAYQGSYRHLFKSILQGSEKAEGFRLYNHNSKDESVNFSSLLNKSVYELSDPLIVDSNLDKNQFRIRLLPHIEVHYLKSYSDTRMYPDVAFPVSRLDFSTGSIDVNGNGVVRNPAQLVVSGAMYESRIANLLPNDYQPEQPVAADTEIDPFSGEKGVRLQEKIYIHRDKPYYYPSEKIYFKGYLNYRTPSLRDTLSRVLYVELIDENRQIIETKILRIDNGTAAGVFQVSNQIQPGNYHLRAYTNWMLNYDSEEFFVSKLPILDIKAVPAQSHSVRIDTAQLSFLFDKKVYGARDRIKVSIHLKDSADRLSSLSVSVTDTNQVYHVFEQSTIGYGYQFSSNAPKIELPFNYPIEYGISLAGHHVDRRGAQQKTTLLIAEEKFESALLLETQPDGLFWLSGFQEMDSNVLEFRYADKVKRAGKILVTQRAIPTTETLNAYTFNWTSDKSQKRKSILSDTSGKARLLNEVTIVSKRPSETKLTFNPKVYGKADVTVKREEMLKVDATSLAEALRGRVAGFNILFDGGKKYIRLGPKSTFLQLRLTEPLLIIDGLQMAISDETVYEQLNRIQTSTVDYVEVIKFGGAAIYGSRGANGVIVVYTKGGNFAFDDEQSKPKPFKTSIFQKVRLAGYSAPVTIQFPDYSKTDEISKVTFDARSTIYWNPEVKLADFAAGVFDFFSADVVTTYKIQVEGVTQGGIPISGTYLIGIER